MLSLNTKRFNLLIAGIVSLLAIGFGFVISFDKNLFSILAILGIAGLIITIIIPVSSIYLLLVTELVFIGGEDRVTNWKMIVFALLVWVMVLTIAKTRERKDLQEQKSWLTPLILFLGACLFSLITAFFFNVNLTSWLRELFPLLNYGLILTSFIFIKTRDEAKRFIWFLSIILFLLLLRDFLYVIQLTNNINIFNPVYTLLTQVFRTNGSPIYSILAILLFLSAFSLKLKNRFIILLAIPALLGAYILIFSGTRTYWAGFLACLLFWFLISIKRTSLFITRIGWAAIVIIIVAQPYFQSNLLGQSNVLGGRTLNARLGSLNSTTIFNDWSYLGRQYETIAAMDIIKGSPVLGHGLGYELTSNARFWTNSEVTRGFVHNSFIYIALKLGIVGLLVFSWFLLGLLFKLWHIHKISSPVESMITSTLLPVFFFILVISFSASKLNDVPTTLILSLLLGVTFKGWKKSKENTNG